MITRESDGAWRKGLGAPPFDETIEATLTAVGDQTIVVIEVGGVPLDKDRLVWRRVADPLREPRNVPRRS